MIQKLLLVCVASSAFLVRIIDEDRFRFSAVNASDQEQRHLESDQNQRARALILFACDDLKNREKDHCNECYKTNNRKDNKNTLDYSQSSALPLIFPCDHIDESITKHKIRVYLYDKQRDSDVIDFHLRVYSNEDQCSDCVYG